MKHAYPQLEWTDCRQVPDSCRRVLVLHRHQPWSRYYELVVGWWNTKEWRREDSQSSKFGLLYQALMWKDIELPIGTKSVNGFYVKRI